jgi:hypothetical protein
MPLMIVDADLEKRLTALGKRQPAPILKTTMARAILVNAVEACADDPHGWYRDPPAPKPKSLRKARKS